MGKKIVIIGGNGFIGNALSSHLSKKHKIVSTYYLNPPNRSFESRKLDITKPDEVESSINQLNPELIIHAAAVKDVKYCENNQELAYKINVDGTKNIARIASKNGIFLIYLSTDYIFDGDKGCYNEYDKPNPTTVYGKTKLEGERVIRSNCIKYAICRTSGVYDYQGRNIMDFIVTGLKKNETRSYFTDIFNSPTYLGNLTVMIEKVIYSNKPGIYHLAGSERINRYNFALKVAETFNYKKSLIKPLELGKDRRFAELRLFDTSLDVKDSQKRLRLKFMDVAQSLDEMRKKLI